MMPGALRVYRVQDAAGRGPFKPGLSARWSDATGPARPPAWQAEFGTEWTARVPLGWQLGCALADLDMAALWFTPTECARLDALGYRMVRLRADMVLCRSVHQLVIARPKPFSRGAEVVAWPAAAGGARPWRGEGGRLGRLPA